jgi:cell wall-associated NlpC family hydrolase
MMSASPLPAHGLRAATLVAALALPATATAAAPHHVAPAFRPLPAQQVLAPLAPGPRPSLDGVLHAEERAERVVGLRVLRVRRVRQEHAAGRRNRATLRRMVRAGNQIATRPYVWGGGHGSFTAGGYDCSGSVSYVLHGGGLLDRPLDSGALAGYGEPGPGRHVSIYANGGHVFMTIDGRRFDTSAMSQTGGTRWSGDLRSSGGYTVRHPAGL